MLSKTGDVDIRSIGAIHGGIFLLAVYLLIPVLGCFFGPKTRFAILAAIGARSGDIARRVTAEVFAMVFVGALAGLALGMASVRYIEALLYQVKATNMAMLAVPAAIIVPRAAMFHGVRIDLRMLRVE